MAQSIRRFNRILILRNNQIYPAAYHINQNNLFCKTVCNNTTIFCNKCISLNTRNLHCSSINQNFLKKLKEEFEKSAKEDEKLKKARENLKKSGDEMAQKSKPHMEKVKKIQKASMSEYEIYKENLEKSFKQKVEELKKTEKFKKLLDKDITKNKKLKFDFKEFTKKNKFTSYSEEDLKKRQELAETSEMIGRTMFSVLSFRPNYAKPKELRKRKPDYEFSLYKEVEPDTETTDVISNTRESVFEKQRANFKKSKMGQSWADHHAKLEESDNYFAMQYIKLTFKVKSVTSRNYATEFSEVAQMISRIEPNFSFADFEVLLERDILPNILEASCQGDEEILKDWCDQKAVDMLLVDKKAHAKEGKSLQRHIYILGKLDILSAFIDPEYDSACIMVSFNTKEYTAVIDNKGDIKCGSLSDSRSIDHTYVLSRDMLEPDNRAAWRILEVSSFERPK